MEYLHYLYFFIIISLIIGQWTGRTKDQMKYFDYLIIFWLVLDLVTLFPRVMLWVISALSYIGLGTWEAVDLHLHIDFTQMAILAVLVLHLLYLGVRFLYKELKR